MNKENKKEITLPSGIKAEVVEYIEAGVIIDMEKNPNSTEFILRKLVLSLDGSSENVYERVRKLRLTDYKVLDGTLTDMLREEVPKVS